MECEEARIREIVDAISDQVKQRRLMMYQYFKDFDRVSRSSWLLLWDSGLTLLELSMARSFSYAVVTSLNSELFYSIIKNSLPVRLS